MRKLFLIMALLLPLAAPAQKVIHYGRFAQANQALPEANGPRIVLFGDSITEGWPEQRPRFFTETGFLGRGIGGEETANFLLRFRSDVLDIGATTVVILGGINDIAENMGNPYNEEITFGHLKSMAELAQAHGVRVILCSVLPSTHICWNEVTDVAGKVARLNARIRSYCYQTGITYLDYYSAMTGPDGCSVREGITTDTVHPNAEGYAIMEKLLLETLAQ